MSLLFIAIGVFALVCTFYKPSFYWNSRKAKRMRRLLGDNGAAMMYYFIGLGVLFIGLLGALNIVSLSS